MKKKPYPTPTTLICINVLLNLSNFRLFHENLQQKRSKQVHIFKTILVGVSLIRASKNINSLKKAAGYDRLIQNITKNMHSIKPIGIFNDAHLLSKSDLLHITEL